MIQTMYSVFDCKAEVYGVPFMAPNDLVAIRFFSVEVQRVDSTNMLFLYPVDYDLCAVGSFDVLRGILTGVDEPRLVAAGLNCTKKVSI
ncbi:MAG: nonstructural protein [Microvirus sp.]|nr:MAG: nonstructural protein [Microvirus sp.]